jgi:iron complex transport system substrate-binding protein
MVGRSPILGLAVALSLAAAQPSRIISTSPSITEMLYAMGLGGRVVGVTTFCHYPPEAAKKAKIGTYLRPDLETIVALRPDLVVAETTGVRRSERIASLKLNVVEVDDGTLAGIYESIGRIGGAAGAEQAAAALRSRIQTSLDGVRSRVAGRPRPRVMFVVGRAPGRIEELVAAGKGSYLNEVINIAGGENIFKDTIAPYARVTFEEVLARNPQVIVDMGEMSDTQGVSEERKRAVVALWGRYSRLAAVRQGRVFAVASDIFVVPGPRVVDAAREFARMFHPGVPL